MVEVASDIGLTISKKGNSVCHRLPSRNPESSPIIAKVGRRETKLRVKTHKRNLKSSSKKTYNIDDVKLLRAELARTLRQRPDIKYVDMINEKVVLTMSNDERHIF